MVLVLHQARREVLPADSTRFGLDAAGVEARMDVWISSFSHGVSSLCHHTTWISPVFGSYRYGTHVLDSR